MQLMAAALWCVAGAAALADMRLMRPVQRVAAGVVATAPTKEFDRFLRKSCLLIVEHGPAGSLGVNLEAPTLLTIGEAAEGLVIGELAARGRRPFLYARVRGAPTLTHR